MPNAHTQQAKNIKIDDQNHRPNLHQNERHKDQLSDDELLRYSRQILLDKWDLEAQLRLKQATVSIIGIGGLGNTAANILSRAGVGTLHLYDYDVVEGSNLQRQIMFYPQHIGLPKAQVVATQLQDMSPWQHITATTDIKVLTENIDDALKGSDLILDCTDNFETRYAINAASQRLGIPLVSAAAQGFTGQLSYFDHNSACYACLFPPSSSNNELDEANNCTTTGVLSSVPIVMGALQADVALIYLGLQLTPLANKLLLWDSITMQQKMMVLNKDPSCTICQSS